MKTLRNDLAFQHYFTSVGEMVVAYTLGENQFTVLQDDAAVILGKLLAGDELSAVLGDMQDQFGPSARDEASAFLDSISPLFFDLTGTENKKGSRERTGTPVSRDLTEEDQFYGFCSQEGIFATSAWELSYTCNLRCVHCYNPHHSAAGELTTDQWLDLLEQAREMGLLRLCLTGGEAGIHPGLWRILAKARSLHLAVDVLTNGWVFADVGLARELASLFPRSIQCSLYGATPATHEVITGVRGSWDRTMRCLKNFTDLGVPIAVKCPAMQLNYLEIPEVARIAEDLGAMLQVDVNITARNDGNDQPTQFRLEEDQLSWLFRQPGLPLYQGLERIGREAIQPPSPEDAVCGAGTNGLSVQPNGVATPCLSFMLPLGRVPQQSLREIWEGHPLSDWRRKQRQDRDGCGGCDLEAHCSFCPGISLNDMGNALSRNPNDCRIAKVRSAIYDQCFPRPQCCRA